MTYFQDSSQSLQSQMSVFVIIGIDNCRFYRCLLLEVAMLNDSFLLRAGRRGSLNERTGQLNCGYLFISTGNSTTLTSFLRPISAENLLINTRYMYAFCCSGWQNMPKTSQFLSLRRNLSNRNGVRENV